MVLFGVCGSLDGKCCYFVFPGVFLLGFVNLSGSGVVSWFLGGQSSNGGVGISGSILREFSQGVRWKFGVGSWHASMNERSIHRVIEWCLIKVGPFLVISEVGGRWTKKRLRSSSVGILALMMV